MKILQKKAMKGERGTLPTLIVLGALLLMMGCSTISLSPSLNSKDKKNLNSVNSYLILVENNLGKWDNLKKAEENLNYAKDAYAQLSPAARTSPRGVEYALEIKKRQDEIDKRKK